MPTGSVAPQIRRNAQPRARPKLPSIIYMNGLASAYYVTHQARKSFNTIHLNKKKKERSVNCYKIGNRLAGYSLIFLHWRSALRTFRESTWALTVIKWRWISFFCLSIILKCSFIGHSDSARASFAEVAASPNVNPKKANYRMKCHKTHRGETSLRFPQAISLWSWPA